MATSVEEVRGDMPYLKDLVYLDLTDLEHQSNAIPWMRAAQEHGGRVRFVPADADGMVDPGDVRKAMTPATRLVAYTHVPNVFGTIQPVREITQIAHEFGALAFVDAAHSAGRVPVRVDEIGCDLIAFCGRKALMGLQGTGFLWGRLELLEKLQPLTTGSRAANVVDEEGFKVNRPPYKLEAGVLNTSGVIGLGGAIQYVEEIGYDGILTHIRDLTAHMIETLRATPLESAFLLTSGTSTGGVHRAKMRSSGKGGGSHGGEDHRHHGRHGVGDHR